MFGLGLLCRNWSLPATPKKLVNQHILPQPQSSGTSDRRKTTQHAQTNSFFRILPPVTNRVTDPAM